MSGRVVWVDEDERIWAPERFLLRGVGFDVTPIGDATTAYALLRQAQCTDFDLIILDVMLLQGDNYDVFSDQTTNGGTETGLILAERLVSEQPDYGKLFLFFSRATKPSLVMKTQALAAKIGGNYLPKREDTQGRHFLTWLRKHNLVRS